MSNPRDSRLLVRAARLLLCALAILLTGQSALALGAFTGSASAAHQLSSLLLVAPASASATTTDACANISVSWELSAGADSYLVQVRENAGAWSTLATVGSTSLVDSTGHPTGASVDYRIFSRDAGSGWQSATATATNALAC